MVVYLHDDQSGMCIDAYISKAVFSVVPEVKEPNSATMGSSTLPGFSLTK